MPGDDHYDADELVAEGQEVDGEQGEIIGLEDDELEAEAAPRRTAPDPGQPTREEVNEHRVDHYPPAGVGASSASKGAALENSTGVSPTEPSPTSPRTTWS